MSELCPIPTVRIVHTWRPGEGNPDGEEIGYRQRSLRVMPIGFRKCLWDRRKRPRVYRTILWKDEARRI